MYVLPHSDRSWGPDSSLVVCWARCPAWCSRGVDPPPRRSFTVQGIFPLDLTWVLTPFPPPPPPHPPPLNHVKSRENPLYRRLIGGSNPRRCITQDSEPNTLPTELFRPLRLIQHHRLLRREISLFFGLGFFFFFFFLLLPLPPPPPPPPPLIQHHRLLRREISLFFSLLPPPLPTPLSILHPPHPLPSAL